MQERQIDVQLPNSSSFQASWANTNNNDTHGGNSQLFQVSTGDNQGVSNDVVGVDLPVDLRDGLEKSSSVQFSDESKIEMTEESKEGSRSGPSLSKSQMAAMASFVVEQKAKGEANRDFSLLQLLETFKSLGFTKEISPKLSEDRSHSQLCK